ncbi:MAG: DinB family protein [Gammaproteobacteria bacterium]
MRAEMLMLARYHAWATEVLFGVVRILDDARYRANVGLFFRSVHGTLNHLLVADQVWYGRCIDAPFTVAGLDTEFETERGALACALRAATERWATWLDTLDDARLASTLVYRNMSGAAFEQPLSSVLLHVFNHATHHRGQISAALTQAGLAAPEMDLVWYLRRAPSPT